MQIEKRTDDFAPFRLWLKIETKAEAEELYAIFNCAPICFASVVLPNDLVREAIGIEYNNEKAVIKITDRLRKWFKGEKEDG